MFGVAPRFFDTLPTDRWGLQPLSLILAGLVSVLMGGSWKWLCDLCGVTEEAASALFAGTPVMGSWVSMYEVGTLWGCHAMRKPSYTEGPRVTCSGWSAARAARRPSRGARCEWGLRKSPVSSIAESPPPCGSSQLRTQTSRNSHLLCVLSKFLTHNMHDHNKTVTSGS